MITFLLRYLLRQPGQLVSKQQLLETIWPDTFVGDAVLKDVIRQLIEETLGQFTEVFNTGDLKEVRELLALK